MKHSQYPSEQLKQLEKSAQLTPLAQATSPKPPKKRKQPKNTKKPKKQPLPSGPLISRKGQISARTATLWRIVSACGMGIALVGAAHIFGAYIETFLSDTSAASTLLAHQTLAANEALIAFTAVIIGILLTFFGAVLDLASGTVGARKEERRLRRRILTATYEGADTRSDARRGTQPADVVADLTDNAERVSEFRVAYWGTTLAALIVPMLTLAYITLAVSPFIGLLLLIAYPLVPLIVGGFMSVFRKRSDASRNEREILSGQYLDAIRNLTVIRLLGAGKRVETRLRDQGERNRSAIMRLLAGNQIVIIILDGAVGLLWITLAVMLTYSRLAAGAITIAQALAVVFLIILLLEPIAQVAGFFYVGMGGIASGKKISAYLREREADVGANVKTVSHVGSSVSASADYRYDSVVCSDNHAHSENAARGNTASGNKSAAVCVKNLSFSYDDAELILHNVSMYANEGERVALVGASGSGKTTLLSILSADVRPETGVFSKAGVSAKIELSLLSLKEDSDLKSDVRLEEDLSQRADVDAGADQRLTGNLRLQNSPTEAAGEVRIAGVNFAEVTPAQARALTAVVAQRTWLFTGTIASNLRIAAPEASDAQLWSALERAHLADDVRRMAQGLQTDVGERGALLSGGQAQRLSIARAFLSGRRVWLLDEPTAQVDAASEQQILAALAELPRSVTVILITHRPALLALADRGYEVRDLQLTPIDPREYATRLIQSGDSSDAQPSEVK